VEMVMLPAGPGPTPTPTPGPTPDPVVPTKPALSTAKHVKLSTLVAHGLTATLTVPTPGSTATLILRQGSHTLGQVTKKHLNAGKVKVRVTLSKAAKRKLRHAKSAHLTLVGKIGATRFRATVLARR
jgi:hypothetical protein